MSVSTTKANEPKDEPAQHCSTASEQCIVESSASVFCEATVVLKGLPSEHVHADCMGEYVKQESMLNSRSVYVGGRDGDMALYFDSSSWIVTTEEDIDDGGFMADGWFLSADDHALAPDRIKAPWSVDQGYCPAPSFRVRKYLGRETILEISGLPSDHDSSSFVGRYTRETCSYNEKPTYKGTRLADGMAIWFCEDSWHVGSKEDIGTHVCSICVDDCARTPDAVQSTWKVGNGVEYDERIQACGALAQQSSSAITTSTSQAQQLSSAPPKLAFVGCTMECENYHGVYTKQPRTMGSRMVYEGGSNGKQAIWYQTGDHQAGWVLGHADNIGTSSCCMSAYSSALTPNAITGPWRVPSMEPCSSVRVTKSKKRHTKVIEVKGVPRDEGEGLALMNGKYRQSSMVGGRLTFKGGQDGRGVFWFDESCGKWRGVQDHGGAGICWMEATDSAATPNAVKAAWHICTSLKPSPYPNVIVPSIEAAEQEIPRLVQLKMCELMAAQHRRCLRCGHEYTAQAEVVFQMKCMHHHCVCCGEDKELGGDTCAVCAEEGGE
jgi:hypothetical protein